MSLTARSPFAGQKRHLTDSPEHPSNSPKRLRAPGASPRKWSRSSKAAKSPSALETLKALFQGMDEKLMISVLQSCPNLDDAIRQLHSLRLQKQASSEIDQATSISSAEAPKQQTEATQPDGNAEGSRQPPAAAQEPAEPASKTPGEWVEGLVQQMASAKDMADARNKAANELRSFEQTVMRSTNKARQGDITAMQAKVSELSKENALLKRAVAIFQGRLNEAANANKEQAAQAHAAVSELQEKIHMLEMSNYSLSMHLREATNATSHASRSHPDVF